MHEGGIHFEGEGYVYDRKLLKRRRVVLFKWGKYDLLYT